MYLFDVNIWVYAHREDSLRHPEMRGFVEEVLGSGRPFAYSPLVLSGFLRVVTHPGVFREPTDEEMALAFTESITSHSAAREVRPGEAHWRIFSHLYRAVRPKGNLVPDVYFAAMAVESGCTWVTTDRDYARFPGLKLEFLP